MDVQEDEYIGDPLSEVPKQQPTSENCMGKRWEKRDGGTVFVGYCRSWPGRGTDHVGEGRCTNHGGHNSGENGQGAPEENDNRTTHGAFKEHFASDLTPAERDAIDDLVDHLTDINDERAIAAEVAAEALIKYKRSADSRFLREARQWFSEFNLIPNEDVFEHTGSGGGPLSIAVNETVVETNYSE